MKNLKQQRKVFDLIIKQYYKDQLIEVLTEWKNIDELVIHWDKLETYTDYEWNTRLLRGLMTYRGLNLAVSISLGFVRMTLHFPRIDTYFVPDDYEPIPGGGPLGYRYFKNPNKPAANGGRIYTNTVIDGDVSSARTRLPNAYKKYQKTLKDTVDALTFTNQLNVIPMVTRDY